MFLMTTLRHSLMAAIKKKVLLEFGIHFCMHYGTREGGGQKDWERRFSFLVMVTFGKVKVLQFHSGRFCLTFRERTDLIAVFGDEAVVIR